MEKVNKFKILSMCVLMALVSGIVVPIAADCSSLTQENSFSLSVALANIHHLSQKKTSFSSSDSTRFFSEVLYLSRIRNTKNQLTMIIKPIDSGYELSIKKEGQHFYAKTDLSFSFTYWEFQTINEDNTKTDLKVTRVENNLQFEGVLHNQKYNKVLEIGALPWFQSPEICLGKLVVSSDEKIEFVVLDPNNMKHRTLQASKSSLEPIEETQEKELLFQKVTMAFGKLWSASLWYDPQTGIFIRYQGKNGNPITTPETIVSLFKINAFSEKT